MFRFVFCSNGKRKEICFQPSIGLEETISAVAEKLPHDENFSELVVRFVFDRLDAEITLDQVQQIHDFIQFSLEKIRAAMVLRFD